MKYLILIFALVITASAQAEQNCSMEWDGKTYKGRIMNDSAASVGMELEGETYYRVIDDARTHRMHDERADLKFKMLKVVPVDVVPVDCTGVPSGVGAWRRITTAALLEVSSDKPAFGSPTDGAPFTRVKSWSLCKGLILEICP